MRSIFLRTDGDGKHWLSDLWRDLTQGVDLSPSCRSQDRKIGSLWHQLSPEVTWENLQALLTLNGRAVSLSYSPSGLLLRWYHHLAGLAPRSFSRTIPEHSFRLWSTNTLIRGTKTTLIGSILPNQTKLSWKPLLHAPPCQFPTKSPLIRKPSFGLGRKP